ncbi:hypothetical protein NMY22_g3419 [Coprinellus aureogranulatus]|nr:hypothetical protein NMY22_g3419 [Coprinellus aureogranulatus]
MSQQSFEFARAQKIPRVLLSPSTRLFILRIVIALSAVVASVAIFEIVKDHTSRDGLTALILAGIAAIHHFATAFGPHFPLTVWADISLTALETLGFFVTTSLCTAKLQLRTKSEPFLLTFFAVWLLSFSILALLLLKVLDVVARRNDRPMRRRVDIGCKHLIPPWDCATQCLFGTTRTVPGESFRLALLRRVLVAVSISVLVAFGVYQVTVAPIYDMGKVRYRQYRASSLPEDIPKNVFVDNWNMIVVWNTWQHDNASASLREAVSAHSLAGEELQCQVNDKDVQALKNETKQREVVEVVCPQGTAVADTVLQINYTAILGSSTLWNWDVASVYLGLTGDGDNTVANTQPIFLFKGRHLIVVMDYHIRQELNPEIATLGFAAKVAYPVASITQILPALLTMGGDKLSTLRFARDDFTPYINVIEDYRDASVLAGIATAGGLGSFLSTLLIILLGTSLMSAISGMPTIPHNMIDALTTWKPGAKPYSPFGILHSIPVLQTKLVDECYTNYPAIKDDLKRQEENPGVLSYLLDTLIDMDALRKHSEAGLELTAHERSGVTGIVDSQDEERSGWAEDDGDALLEEGIRLSERVAV